MSMPRLPPSIAAYFGAFNAHDAEAVGACFTSDGVVRDEGKTHAGRTAVRSWAAAMSERYRPTLTVIDVLSTTDGDTVLACRVSGDFPSSPVELRFAFACEGEKIARLEISK